ncbi:hypothetical protein [Flexithrix dorotheae]|uniref:Nmad3 family putative nucleotide modification protein n=1 Tax=Flexithrix dorotheae TaxID=70993 RepID=UPI00036B647E|nr:hypothetical protein [Flexithrix dorotheae]
MRKPKIILSRKGFDSGTGGIASPILDNRMYSLPIPEAESGIFYNQLNFSENHSYLYLLRDLGIKFYSETHLDPDLNKEIISGRTNNWRPVFGQTGAALSHLNKFNIQQGDLFLFFGWFKEVEKINHRIRFKKSAKDLHVIYGYLEVDQMVDLEKGNPPSWACKHPHVVFADQYNPKGNTLFIAKKESSFFSGKPGGGLFSFSRELVLTNSLQENSWNRSLWQLPKSFFQKGRCKLSYHENKTGEAIKGNRKNLCVQSVARGQEFIINSNQGILNWVQSFNPYII